MRSFLSRLFGTGGDNPGPLPIRDRGRPPSGNGASSLHLIWQVPGRAFTAIRATLDVTEPPQTQNLYFFALQATFRDGGTEHGGGHVGLQWNSRHPESTAINWGGYQSQRLGGAVLAGTESTLPSRPNDPNTRDYHWEPNHGYQLTIDRGARPGWWRGTVTDRVTGSTTVIRELDGGGTHLAAPLVWAEVFAPCDGPSVTVHWSDLAVADESGQWHSVTAAITNYQAWEAGGCTNTNSRALDRHFEQATNTVRTNPGGRSIQLGD